MTLVELLVVIGALVLLMAFLFPIIGRSTRRGMEVEEAEYMRQIGIARSLYSADFDEHSPGLASLLATGRVPEGVSASSLDPSPRGWRNEIIAQFATMSHSFSVEPGTQRTSFLCSRDVLPSSEIQRIESQAGDPGWLVGFGLNPFAHLGRPIEMMKGRHFQLTVGNSILRRPSAQDGSVLSIARLYQNERK